MSTPLVIAAIIATVVALAAVEHWAPVLAEWLCLASMAVNTALAATDFATGHPFAGTWMAACALANGWAWWDHRKRRKRKRAAALAGAKSRARVAALVARLRAAHRARPVPQPVPR